MNTESMKEMVAKLLEDARRLQKIEPNAGTTTRIREAEALLSPGTSVNKPADHLVREYEHSDSEMLTFLMGRMFRYTAILIADGKPYQQWSINPFNVLADIPVKKINGVIDMRSVIDTIMRDGTYYPGTTHPEKPKTIKRKTRTTTTGKIYLRIGFRHRRIPCESIESAQKKYCEMRDESGEGFSTWPDGIIFIGDNDAIYLSYNGRMWADMAQTIPYKK